MKRLVINIFIFILILGINTSISFAQLGKFNNNENKEVGFVSDSKIIHTKLQINDSIINIYVPDNINYLTKILKSELQILYHKFNNNFYEIPSFESEIRLLEESEFFRITKAPLWTNALYVNGNILIPVNNEVLNNQEGLKRTVRHEFSHSLINALTNGKCPGWLDEGIAQWAEGDEHIELKEMFDDYIAKNNLISFEKLQKGFTGLELETVAAAYAQSLYASKLLIKLSGKEKISDFFKNLKSNKKHKFKDSFGFDENDLKFKLEGLLKKEI
mgnify:CR=1 FL=1